MSETTNNYWSGRALAKESEKGAQQEMQECMVSVSPLQSLDPDEYGKKITHTTALKRVTESTRQKDAKKKLTRQASEKGGREDIESRPVTSKVESTGCSGSAQATTWIIRSSLHPSMVGGRGQIRSKIDGRI